MDGIRTISFTIDSRIENVSILGVAIAGICHHLGMSEEIGGQTDLCVEEAVINIIMHGYGQQPGHPITVDFVARPTCLELHIRDQGTPIPAERWETSLLEMGKNMKEGGRGLQLIRCLMTESRYEHSSQGNAMTLIKDLLP